MRLQSEVVDHHLVRHGIDPESAGTLGSDPDLAPLRKDARFLLLVEEGKKRAELAARR